MVNHKNISFQMAIVAMPLKLSESQTVPQQKRDFTLFNVYNKFI